MSIVIHGNNFVELQQGQVVKNVTESSGDTVTIKFNRRYFLANQYFSYIRQLIENGHIVTPSVNQNITPTSWLKVWKHFTNNQEARVMCCTCNQRRATVGGHAVLGNQYPRAGRGLNSVFIIPICGRCNRQNRNLNITRDIRAVKLFDYYSNYGKSFITGEEKYGIRITHIEISQRTLQKIQNNEINGNADYGNIDQPVIAGQQGRQGRQEPQAGQARMPYYNNGNADYGNIDQPVIAGQQGRQGRQEPQAGQARRPVYYNNRNAYR